MEVPGQESNLSHCRPQPLQWQCWIHKPLGHRGTPQSVSLCQGSEAPIPLLSQYPPNICSLQEALTAAKSLKSSSPLPLLTWCCPDPLPLLSWCWSDADSYQSHFSFRGEVMKEAWLKGQFLSCSVWYQTQSTRQAAGGARVQTLRGPPWSPQAPKWLIPAAEVQLL